MNYLISGSTGLVGSALCESLAQSGNQVWRLVRSKEQASSDTVFWDPLKQVIDPLQVKEIDCVIHLGGENIASGRWSEEKKKQLYDSRILSTRFLVEQVLKLSKTPKLFISASAIGFYGNRGDELLTEGSSIGEGFLAELCKDWEDATVPLVDQGMRVVNLRIGVVLSSAGGALKKMLPAFKAGVAGPLGNGKQYMSWIALEDLITAIEHIIDTEILSGAINLVSPNSVTNKEFTKTLANVLNRPALIPAPALALKLALGEMAEALLLSSTRVTANLLIGSGFEFRYPELEGALRGCLGSSQSD